MSWMLNFYNNVFPLILFRLLINTSTIQILIRCNYLTWFLAHWACFKVELFSSAICLPFFKCSIIDSIWETTAEHIFGMAGTGRGSPKGWDDVRSVALFCGRLFYCGTVFLRFDNRARNTVYNFVITRNIWSWVRHFIFNPLLFRHWRGIPKVDGAIRTRWRYWGCWRSSRFRPFRHHPVRIFSIKCTWSFITFRRGNVVSDSRFDIFSIVTRKFEHISIRWFEWRSNFWKTSLNFRIFSTSGRNLSEFLQLLHEFPGKWRDAEKRLLSFHHCRSFSPECQTTIKRTKSREKPCITRPYYETLFINFGHAEMIWNYNLNRDVEKLNFWLFQYKSD